MRTSLRPSWIGRDTAVIAGLVILAALLTLLFVDLFERPSADWATACRRLIHVPLPHEFHGWRLGADMAGGGLKPPCPKIGLSG